MTLPTELIIHIFSFLNIKINDNIDIKYIDRCCVCSMYFINPYNKYYCSASCLDQILLMM